MPQAHRLEEVALSQERSLKTLVENRSAWTLERCELNVFETYRRAELVPLTFHEFVVTSMLTGKKVMHLPDTGAFDYHPGESVLVPAGVTMQIDFPEAEDCNPTQCIALAIDEGMIRRTLDFLNEKHPKVDDSPWRFSRSEVHIHNSLDIATLLNRIIALCSGDLVLKDVLAELALKELIVHVIQAQQRAAANACVDRSPSDPLSYIIQYIRQHITEELNMEDLTKRACMSRSAFYRGFRREYGISPLEYILSERIRMSKEMLSDTRQSVKSVAYSTGFRDVNYFIRLFRKMEGITPGRYMDLLGKKYSA